MNPELTEDQRGVADLISMISEELYCAGWRSGIEFELWGYIDDPKATPEPWRTKPSGGLLKLLKHGSTMIDGWIHHDQYLDEVFVPLEEWVKLYALYLERAAEATSAEAVPVEKVEQLFAEWDKNPLDIEQWRHIGAPAAAAPAQTSYFAQHWTDRQAGRATDSHLQRPIELIRNGDRDAILTVEEAQALVDSLLKALAEEARH